jgi:hypothetical protein
MLSDKILLLKLNNNFESIFKNHILEKPNYNYKNLKFYSDY